MACIWNPGLPAYWPLRGAQGGSGQTCVVNASIRKRGLVHDTELACSNLSL